MLDGPGRPGFKMELVQAPFGNHLWSVRLFLEPVALSKPLQLLWFVHPANFRPLMLPRLQPLKGLGWLLPSKWSHIHRIKLML